MALKVSITSLATRVVGIGHYSVVLDFAHDIVEINLQKEYQKEFYFGRKQIFPKSKFSLSIASFSELLCLVICVFLSYCVLFRKKMKKIWLQRIVSGLKEVFPNKQV